MRRTLLLLTVLLCPPGFAANAIQWQTWGPELFVQAQKQQKPIYLYLEAVWCHWCHVMQEDTLQDPAIIAHLNQRYLPVRVDHDARPDLANRYRAWGWPANILFSADGKETARRAGYLAPTEFLALLKNPGEPIVAVPQATARSGGLDEKTRNELQRRHERLHDTKIGGLKGGQKYLDREHVEYALLRAAQGDKAAEKRARQTLDAALALVDPVWGGFYQYSTMGGWQHPHFEKLLRVQAAYLRSYALAYAQFGEPRYLDAARRTRDYLAAFLSDPKGGFYSSQDADLKPGQKSAAYFALDDGARRAQGIPRVDRHLYAQENGWAIEAHALLFEATGDPADLAPALRAAERWQQAHPPPYPRELGQSVSVAGPFLSDQLGLARGWLALHRATGERRWFDAAVRTADYIGQQLQRPQGGFRPSPPGRDPLEYAPDLEDNVHAVRFFNLLQHYSGQSRHQTWAQNALGWLAQPEVALSRVEESGVLLADAELSGRPAHLTVVGNRQDSAARELYRTALATPGAYKRVEFWDRDEGPLPHPDVPYPQLTKPAGYVCTEGRCSSPSFDAKVYRQQITALLRPATR